MTTIAEFLCVGKDNRVIDKNYDNLSLLLKEEEYVRNSWTWKPKQKI